MHLKTALAILSILLVSCKPPMENKKGEGSPDYPVVTSLVESIDQSSRGETPDPMALLLKNNREVMEILQEENYPVVLLWIKPEQFEAFLQNNNIDIESFKLDPRLSFFLKSHIYRGDIPELGKNYPIKGSVSYKSHSGLIWKLNSKRNGSQGNIEILINGIIVDGCYFAENNSPGKKVSAVGKICYINDSVIEIN